MAFDTFNPSDTLPEVETKLDANAAKSQALLDATGLTEGATTIGSATAVAGASASSDTIVDRLIKLDGRLGDIAGPATSVVQDLDLDAVTADLTGTTYINDGSGVADQYPAVDKLFIVEVEVSEAPTGTSIEAGRVVKRTLTSQGTDNSAQVWFSTRSQGVSSDWRRITDGLPPNLLTQDTRERTYLTSNANSNIRALISGGKYRLESTTAAQAAANSLPYVPPSDESISWDVTVDRIDTLVGRITAQARYSASGAAPTLHKWVADVTLASSSATEWSAPEWLYCASRLPRDPNAGSQRIKAAPRELWLKAGQSGAVGVDHRKEDGVNQEAFDADGVDAPHPRVFEVSRGAAHDPITRADEHELHLARHFAADRTLNTVNPGDYFGATRCNLNPEIQQLALVNSADGGSALSDWAVGSSNFNNAVSRCNDFLIRNPDFKFMGIIWHQGESDALDGRTQAQYEADLTAIVAGWRSQITGAADSVFIAGTMTAAWRAVDTSAATIAVKAGIHAAHLRTAAYITNGAVVNLDDLEVVPNTVAFQTSSGFDDDIIHFGREHIREAFRRYAETAQTMTNIRSRPGFASYRMRYSSTAGKYVNALDPSIGNIYSQRFVSDPDRGMVLSTDVNGDGSAWEGFYTDLTHDLDQYTLSVRVRLKGTINNGMSFISHGDNGDNQAKIMAVNVINHGNFSDGSGSGFAGDIASDTWIMLSVTFDGTNFQRYINGVADGAAFPPVVADPAFNYNQLGHCQVGRWGSGTDQRWQGLIDDVFVASSALPAEKILELFRS